MEISQDKMQELRELAKANPDIEKKLNEMFAVPVTPLEIKTPIMEEVSKPEIKEVPKCIILLKEFIAKRCSI